MTTGHWPDEERAPLGEHEPCKWKLDAAERDVQSILGRYTALEAKLTAIRDAYALYNTGRLALEELEGVLEEELRR